MTKSISFVDFIGNNALRHFQWGTNIGSNDQILCWKCLSSNAFATRLRMDCKNRGKSCSCDLLWSRLKQLNNSNDIKLEFDSLCKLVVRRLFESHFHTKIWSCEPIFLSQVSTEVCCFHIKSSQDINLIIFVYRLLGNYCLNNLEQHNCCLSPSNSR